MYCKRQFNYFGDTSFAIFVAMEMNNDVKCRIHVLTDGVAAPLRAMLQHQRFNALNRMHCRVRVTARH